jgi:large subunit ribosomal protein L30e
MDMITALKRIIETGKIERGSEKALDNLASGKAKMVVIALNCPKKLREKIENRAKIDNVPLLVFPGTALQLGEVCGKPFLVASLTVLDAGTVSLKDLKA